MTIAPKTKAEDIGKDIAAQLDAADGYLDPYSFDVAGIKRAIRTVEASNHEEAENLWIQLYAAVNDVDALREGYASACKRGANAITFLNYAKALADLGYYSDAATVITPFVDASSGCFTSIAGMALQMGMVSAVIAEYQRAKEMRMDVTEAENAYDVAQVLHKGFKAKGVTEDLFRSHLVVVGEVFREFAKQPGPYSYQGSLSSEHDHGIVIHCRIRASVAELWRMNLRLAEVMVDRGIDMHEGFSFGFARNTRDE